MSLLSNTNSLHHNIPNYSIRLIQTYRIFDLIQQNIKSPKPIINGHNLQQFLKQYHPQIFNNQTNNVVKLMHQINQQGLQLNQENFGINLAKSTKQLLLTSDQSMQYYYKQLRDLFTLKYQKPYQQFQKWDLITSLQQMKNKQWIEMRYQQIQKFHDNLKMYLDGMEIYTFQNSLEQVLYCLSINMLPLQLQKQERATQICKTFINPTILQHISQFLNTMKQYLINMKMPLHQEVSQNCDNILRYFKLITYFYTMCKNSQLKNKIESHLCMVSHDTFKILVQGLKIMDDRIKYQVSICLAMVAKYIPSFIQWVLSDMDGIFVPLLRTFAQLGDNQGIYNVVVCLKKILIKYRQKSTQFKNSSANLTVMNYTYQFSIFVLKTSQRTVTQHECMLIISQLLKVCQFSFDQIQQLKMTTKVFLTSEQIQKVLVPSTLRILETAIIKKNQDLTNIIIKDSNFLTGLASNLSSKKNIFFYQFLHIVYLLSFDNLQYLIDKGILQKIFEMTYEQQTNATMISLNCYIILNIVQKSLQKQNDSLLELLYQKFRLFDRIVPYLFGKCFQRNLYLDIFLQTVDMNGDISIPGYAYFDKNMLMNVFKLMYWLAVGVSRRHKKYAFSRKLNDDIIKSLYKILEDLFRYDNKPLIELILRQKILIFQKMNKKTENGIELYKIINIILEEMTYNMEKRPILFLKEINYLKNTEQYSNNLLKSQFFTLHELQVQSIPIYLNIEFEYNQNKIKRSVPHRFQLNSLKNYIKSFVVKQMQIKQSEIKDVVLRHVDSNKFIENEVQYRSLVNKLLDKRINDIGFHINQIVYNRRDDMLAASFIGGGGLDNSRMSQGLSNSFIGRQTGRSRVIQNNRYTNLNEQPINSDLRRSFHTPNSFNYSSYTVRNTSPVFGQSRNQMRTMRD